MHKGTIFILLFSIVCLPAATLRSQISDIQLLRQINHSALPLKPLSIALSETTIPINLAIPAGMAVTALLKDDNTLMQNAIGVAMASGINWGLTVSLKKAIRRDRPHVLYDDVLDIYQIRSDYAMPSGHTSSAFATATSLTLLYPEWYVALPAYAWASAVGMSRIHLGVHYPTDVLAGAALGVASAWLTYKLNRWIWNRYCIDGMTIRRK